MMITAVGCDTLTSVDTDSQTIADEGLSKNSHTGTRVPGHNKAAYDQDGNGFPDAGIEVNGHYTSLYAYDSSGDWYWDLGDGRIFGSVGSVDDLGDEREVCKYVNNYRADFGNDPFMNSGWIQNHITCTGFEGNAHFNYLIVHKSDPRYTGNPEWAEWGEWEYIVLTETGSGNVVKRTQPQNHVGG